MNYLGKSLERLGDHINKIVRNEHLTTRMEKTVDVEEATFKQSYNFKCSVCIGMAPGNEILGRMSKCEFSNYRDNVQI